MLAGEAEVALRGDRVVPPPLGHRGPGDRGGENVGPAQDGKRGEVAAERPAAYADVVGVELARVLPDDVLEGAHLVVEAGGGDVEPDLAFPGRAAGVRATAVRDDHCEP